MACPVYYYAVMVFIAAGVEGNRLAGIEKSVRRNRSASQFIATVCVPLDEGRTGSLGGSEPPPAGN